MLALDERGIGIEKKEINYTSLIDPFDKQISRNKE